MNINALELAINECNLIELEGINTNCSTAIPIKEKLIER